MNHTLRWINGLAFMLALFCQTSLAQTINVVHSGKWPPYADAGLPEQGLAVELVTTALKRAGYTPVVNIDSLDRILEGGRLGVYDVFATPWFSEERNQYLHYSEPYLESYIRFIKKKDKKFEYESFTDLKGVMIGVVAGYAYDEAFNESRDIIKISERNLIQNLLKLNQGRIDLTLDDELVLAVRGIHIGVSRENPKHEKIAADFNKAIADMKKDGTYDLIVSKHHIYIKKPAQ